MSYNNSSIKIYTNLLNHDPNNREYNLNYAPNSEPSASGETYTCSGGDTSGPLYDLVDNKQDTVVTFDSDSQNTTITIDFDLTSNITPDAVIIMGHNFESNATLEIQRATVAQTIVNGYSGSLQEEGYFQLEGGAVDDTEYDAYDSCLLCTFDGTAGNDWQIELTPGAGSYISDLEIGEVAFCNTWTQPHAPEVDSWQDSVEYNADVTPSRGGQNYSQGYGGERKAWNLSWTAMDNAKKEALQQAFRETKGPRFPFWIDMGEDASDVFLYYVRLTTNPVYTPIAGGTLWNVSISIRAEI